MRIKSILSTVFIFLLIKGYSQPCTTLGQTPSTAFPVCGTSTFNQSNVPTCGGTPIPGPCGAGLADVNPFYYRFTCYTGGTLGFVIDPINNADDYDWALFDITGRNPNDIYTIAALNISDNWSATTGNTGTSLTATGLSHCAGGTPNFSAFPTLIAGHEYLLMVSNWSASQQGYSLNFAGGSAVITDPVPPKLQGATAVDCGGQWVRISFNKKIRCNSLAANGSDFVLSPNSGTISNATGFFCTAGFDMDSAVITFSAPLPPGNYTLALQNGSDGNTLLDNCGTGMANGEFVSFTVPPRPPLPMGTVVTWPPGDCNPVQIRITFPQAVMCASAALDGSDFIVTGPAPVAISGIIPVCTAPAETNGFTIQFTAPLTVGGVYTVQMATGSDGNTIIDRCNSAVPAGLTAQFSIAAQAPIPMGTVNIGQCAPTSLTINFTDPINCNSVAADGSDFTITGPAATTITGAAAVNCTNGQTNSITLQFAAPITAGGNYQVQAATGTDGTTLTGLCGSSVTAGTTAAFTLPPSTPIAMGTVTQPTCLPTSIVLTFAEPINCSSIASDGSDFTINVPATVSITAAVPENCTNGQTNTVRIHFTMFIAGSGTYEVQVATGTDGNTLTGQCGRIVNAGSIATFTLPVPPPIAMGTVTPPPCLPTTLALTFAEPINCNSIAANGSDFIISGPSAVTITAANAVCTNGQTTAITLTLAAPIAVGGSYQVQAAVGSDGNPLLGSCLHLLLPGTSTSFNVAIQPPLAMGTIAAPPCIPMSVTLTFPEPINCGSIAANGSDFIVTGASPVTVASATGVNCVNGETNTITLTFITNILTSGNYQVQVVTGSDGNTLTGQCGKTVPANSNASFTLAAQPPLPIGAITPPDCAPNSLTITYTTDPLDCTSLSTNGSEFVITGPSAVTVISATGQCNINPNQRTITLFFAAPITVSGTYQLQVVNGTDGNTIRGDCNRYITVGDFTTFTIPDAFYEPMDSLAPIGCAPSALRLVFDNPIRCASIAPDGSDFTITGPSPVTISGVIGACNAMGTVNELTIQLATPIVVGGTYTIELNAGNDGNTLWSECFRSTPAGSQLNFVLDDTVSAVFQHQIQYDCETDLITFAHDGQHNVNQWTWTVNGVQASTLQTFSQSFSASSQNTIQLTVSNGLCSDTYSENIVLDNKLTAAFSGPEMICPEDTAVFRDLSTGQIDTWSWTFGNGNTSTSPTPPTQSYPLTGSEMLYTVSLTISNPICQTTATKTVKVFAGCLIAVPTAFTPDGNGVNDYLYPLNAFKADNLDFKVFNRWGQLVFHSRNWTSKWDGRIGGIEQATGVYVWTLNYTHRDTKVKYTLRGMTTLIR